MTVRRIVYLVAIMTLQEIVDNTHITLEEVGAALIYYKHNREEIDRDIWEQAMLAEKLEKEYFEKLNSTNS